LKKLLIILSSTALLSACGTTTKIDLAKLSAPIAKDEARIVVTRDTSLLYIAAQVDVRSNGSKIASLGRGGSVVHDVPEGDNSLQVSVPSAFGQFVVRFDAEEGKTYKFLTSPKGDALFLGTAFGALGDAVNATISDTSGYFRLELMP